MKLNLAAVVETSAKQGSSTLEDAFFIAVINAIDSMANPNF